jgi:uracil-DNA glycosylase
MQQDLALGPGNRLAQALPLLLDGLDDGWQTPVNLWRQSAKGRSLLDYIEQRRSRDAIIYPIDPLRALRLTPLDRTRVVILGQDPYHGPEQAEGLAFSVPAALKLPPSLRNIFKELQRDLGLAQPRNGHLGAWARRGVLLLNTCLTVEDGQPASHAGRGWETLTDALIATAAAHIAPKVFMLWGAHAQSKRELIQSGAGKHLVLECNHPSPLSAMRGETPFIGCGHFSKARDFLADRGHALDWSL